jgi:hypothetical protein
VIDYTKAQPIDVRLVRTLLDEGRSLQKAEVKRRWGIEPRKFRAAISELRRQGYPVVSWSTAGSVYRKAHDEAELEAFLKAEILSRATDLFTQATAMRRDARAHFEPIQQQLIASGRR